MDKSFVILTLLAVYSNKLQGNNLIITEIREQEFLFQCHLSEFHILPWRCISEEGTSKKRRNPFFFIIEIFAVFCFINMIFRY